MFIGREKEIALLIEQLQSKTKSISLIYGKRRVGKTTLVKKASEGFKGTIISFEAIRAKMNINIQRFASSIASSFGEREYSFSDFKQAFDYISAKPGKKLVLFDEYPDLKYFENSETVDSIFREICDSLSEDVKLVITGSQIKMMKSLLEEDNPLFGRFTLTLKLEEFDYLTASKCYSEATARKKVELYSVFGGLPFISTLVNPNKTLEENIEKLLIPATGQARLYIENVLQSELASISYGQSLLAVLGNGKLRYSEIEAKVGGNTSGGLARQLEYLLDLELIRKVSPINKKDDKKKTFYEISNNLVRFYYAYLSANQGQSSFLSEHDFYETFISHSIETFISFRFEDIACQYLARQSYSGKLKNVLDIGRYWYDDKQNKTNAEFDCVVKTSEGYYVYEVKYYKNKLTKELCDKEKHKIMAVDDLKACKIGFISLSGFAFTSSDYMMIEGKELYETNY